MTSRRAAAVTLPLALLMGAGGCDLLTGSESEGPRFPTPISIPALGMGAVPERNTSEIWVHGDYAYTGTHGYRGDVAGNVVKVWRVTGDTPVLVDSLVVRGAPAVAAHPGDDHEEGEGGHQQNGSPDRIADLQVSDDGKLLVVATEGGPGGITLYDLADPAHPAEIGTYSTANTRPGVHTAEVARVNGRLYAFLCVDPAAGVQAKLVIVDVTDPRAPQEVMSRVMGRPYVHDVYVRDGILFTALWDDGVGIWDVGGGGQGGSVSNPVAISRVETQGGNAHNVYWFHDPRTGSRRWLFVGEEQPAGGGMYTGDVHVVDVADLANPLEVAFFRVPGAGTHNFSVDERAGILYAAYYHAGVRALDIRGDLGECRDDQRVTGRCDLSLLSREAGRGLHDTAEDVMVWGVKLSGNSLYASDVRNGIWKLDARRLR